MSEGGGGSGCEAAGSWPGESQVGNFFLQITYFFKAGTSFIVKHSGGGGAAPPSLNVALHPSYR